MPCTGPAWPGPAHSCGRTLSHEAALSAEVASASRASAARAVAASLVSLAAAAAASYAAWAWCLRHVSGGVTPDGLLPAWRADCVSQSQQPAHELAG
jgi:hypothetical protein